MLTLHVQFTSGREVLGHYWGLLSGGGLSIDLASIQRLSDDRVRGVRDPGDETDEADGEAGAAAEVPLSRLTFDEALEVLPVNSEVRLEVHVTSIRKTYPLDVRVVELRQPKDRLQLVVSFLHSLPPDELLDAAWADGCDAPQRRSRRLPLRTPVRFDRLDGAAVETSEGYLLNLSVGGCCIEGMGLPPPGTQVVVSADLSEGENSSRALKLVGRVRWTEKPSDGLMGIEFLKPAPEVQALLQAQGLVPDLDKDRER